MSAAMQLAIVIVLVIAAAVYLGRRVLRKTRRDTACDCGCGVEIERRR